MEEGNKHGVRECLEARHLRPKDQVAELRECQEHDCKHHRKAGEILRARSQRDLQLRHRLAEIHVLEHLDNARIEDSYHRAHSDIFMLDHLSFHTSSFII